MLLEPRDREQNSIVNELDVDFLVLSVDARLVQDLLFLVERRKDILDLAELIRKLLCSLRYRNLWDDSAILRKVLVLVDKKGSLRRNYVEQVLKIFLNNFDLINKLVYVNAVLLDSWAMSIHDGLADVAFVSLSWGDAIAWSLFAHVVVGSWHLLHLHIGCNRFLSIDLTNERLHTLGDALA